VSGGARVRGFTLVELVVALVLSAVVLGGAYAVLVSSQRFYRAQSAVLEVHQGMRAVVQVLSAELRELDASAGDIIALAPDSISIRAMRGLSVLCAPPDGGTGRIVLRESLSFGFRAVDPARDRALVFHDGDPASADDDAWLDLGVSSVNGGASCRDGAPGVALDLGGRTAELDSVTVGSPVRFYERAVYRLYADEGGAWWLGIRSYSGGAWAAVSPVAGPLWNASGLVFSYYDATGERTATPSRVARIGLAVRGLSSAPLQGTGGRLGRYRDSLEALVLLRNGREAGLP
jgi:prepilin-type N-terminal cleavage/methylation domain-containing protein